MPWLDLTVLQFPGAINIFWVFHSTVYSKEVSVWVRLTGDRHSYVQNLQF